MRAAALEGHTANQSAGRLGVMLVLISAVVFSFAGIFTKAIAADSWSIIAWRGALSAPLIIAYAWWRERPRLAAGTFRLGWRGWLLATVGALASMAFVAAFKLTFIGNVAIVYATVPFVAGAIGWLILREAMSPATMLAGLTALLGVGVMASGSTGTGHMSGDLLAFGMTFLMATFIVLVRRFPGVPVVLANAASSVQLAVAGLVLGAPFAMSFPDMVLSSCFAVSFAVAAILLTEGARLIPAAQVGLFGLLETPLAPLLALLLLGEVIPGATVAGGAIVLTGVLALTVHELRAVQRAPDRAVEHQ